MSNDQDEKLESIAELLINTKPILFFTGAGVSVPSGIPDFRSPGGLWDKYDPNIYGSLMGFKSYPKKVWSFFRDLYRDLINKEPNAAHFAITEIQNELGIDNVTIVTQNIDNLHQKAGSKNVLEIHGTLDIMHCINCSFEESFQESKHIDVEPFPRCPKCENPLKPKAILFGEGLPQDVYNKAVEVARSSAVLIAAGTSLEVFPANKIFLKPEKPVKVLLNLESTAYKNYIDYIIIDDVVESLPALVTKLKALLD